MSLDLANDSGQHEPIIKKTRKPRKVKEIPISPFASETKAEYYGSRPILVKWKHWILMCNIIKMSDTFKKIYAKENFKYGDLESTAFVVHPVYTKEPQIIRNLDGQIIEEIPGIYDEEQTMVLPPKFVFPIYRRYFLSSVELAPYLEESQPEILEHDGFDFKMNFGPRDEQKDLAEMAGNALSTQKFFKGIVQAAPGWGKTYISINIGSQTKGQVLVVVPNNLLASQWKKSILDFTNLTEDDIGMMKGSDLEKLKKKGMDKKPFNIILIQSLDSQLQRANFQELIDFYRNTSIVFYDETHTSGAADGYAKTTGIFSTFNIVGLSATPYKKDKNLFQLYTGIGQIVYISTHQNLIPNCNMHLLDTPITPKEQRELFDIFQKTNYNFFMSKLEDYLFKVDAYFVYIAEWLLYRYKQGFSTVVLFKTNKMLDKLKLFMEKLLEKDTVELKLTILTNETAKKNRKELESSDVVLSNYKMFSAGADVPHLSCIFFASMVLSKTTIIQSLGRVTRKHDTKVQEVQAHFLLPKFIYPLYSNNEPHLTIVRAVKVQYSSAQFKWDKGFTNFFEERKNASQNLNSNQFSQAQYPNGTMIPAQSAKGDFIVQGNINSGELSNNRLEAFRQQQQHKIMIDSLNNGGTGLEHIQKPPSAF